MAASSLLWVAPGTGRFTEESGQLTESHSTTCAAVSSMALMERPSVSSIVLSALAVLSVAVGASARPGHVWTVIAVDPLGDGREPAGFDAAQLSYQYDKSADRLWLRLALFELPKVDEFKVELAIDAGTNDARTPWWGTNTAFTFDRLVSARVNRRAGTQHASVEIRGKTGSTMSRQAQHDDAEVRVTDDVVLIGFKRAALLGATMNVKLIAAVGSDVTWNDEIPNNRSATIDLQEPRDTRRLREFDVSRNNLTFAPGQPVLSETTPPRITERGRGPQTLILIPGANDLQRGERARRQVESAPLPVKIRYLIESMAWDHRGEFERLGVPVLALIPGFSEQLLANPRFGWFKAAFQDSWEPLRKSARLELTTVTDARALMLDDQPSLVDEAIARFVDRRRDHAVPDKDNAFLIRDVRVFDGTRVLSKADLLVSNGHID